MQKGRRKLSKYASLLLNKLRTHLAIAGLDRTYYKVFAIGLNKTATSSIHKTFVNSGFQAVHNTKWAEKPLQIRYLSSYRAFSDGGPKHFDQYDAVFPRSKFILNVRNLDEWIDSRLEHIRYLSQEYGKKGTGNWTDTPESVQQWIVERNQHHLKVLKYFENRPKDLLIINYIREDDASRRITDFIERPALDHKPYFRPIPKTREIGVLKNEDMIMECAAKLSVPMDELKFDLFCPSLVEEDDRKRFPCDTAFLSSM